jgi:hypothetical protein
VAGEVLPQFSPLDPKWVRRREVRGEERTAA